MDGIEFLKTVLTGKSITPEQIDAMCDMLVCQVNVATARVHNQKWNQPIMMIKQMSGSECV